MIVLKYLRNSLVASLVLVTFVSCGGKKTTSTKRTTKITDAQIEYVMDNQYMSCDSIDGSACPEGVARLLILNKDDASKSAVCSGFLVNKDTLVTNNHCVNYSSCKNTYIAIYTSNGGYIRNKCKSIVQTNKSKYASIDYTVLKLETEFTGSTFEVTSDIPDNGEKVTAWVIDHTGLDALQENLYDSRVTEFECIIENRDYYSGVYLKECPAISGNSGSVILNSNGTAFGVIWGGTEATDDFNTRTPLKSRRSSEKNALVSTVNLFIDYLN